MNKIIYRSADRHHDISCGHRVYGHEGKCAHLHGHNYRIHFSCTAPRLDTVGRIIDFGAIKSLLCNWLEENWDHKFLLWADDPWVRQLSELDPNGLVIVPFNPTAENMGEYLLMTIGPVQLAGTDISLVRVKVEETRKCSADAWSIG